MRALLLVALLIMDSWMNPAAADIDCSTVASLASSCSDYVMYGSRNVAVDSPCCNALDSLHNIASEPEDRRDVCKCLVGLMSMYSPNLTAVDGLPSLCEIPFGIPLDPRANCDL
ncbi:putative non-specific lipid-transfer protein 14 [Nymphaea colorata]|nr:putative non-specific lipid-transfer protein 14 [Nymphaea colorata]